jgi:hypothetical protein
MADQRAQIQRRIAAGLERASTSASSFSAALHSARSIADQTVSHRGISPSHLYLFYFFCYLPAQFLFFSKDCLMPSFSHPFQLETLDSYAIPDFAA